MRETVPPADASTGLGSTDDRSRGRGLPSWGVSIRVIVPEAHLPAAPERPDGAARRVVEVVKERLVDTPPDALYVATGDAGAHEAVGFWADANAMGLRFASPRAFPWTLATSITGHVAAALGIRGPTTTVVGRAEAAVAALIDAHDDICDGAARRALVLGVDVRPRLRLAALLLVADLRESAPVLSWRSSWENQEVQADLASTAVAALAAAALCGASVGLTDAHGGWIALLA